MIPASRRIAASPKLNSPRKRRIVIAIDAMLRPFGPLLVRAAPRKALCPPDPHRILLIRMDGIGDLMMSTAIFPALRQRYPTARIDLLCSTLVLPLAKLLVEARHVDCLYTLPLAGVTPAMWRRTVAALRAGRYDVAADLRGDFRNVLLMWLAKIPRRIGLPYCGLDFLLTDRLPLEAVHSAEEVARAAEALGVKPAPRQPQLDLPPAVMAWADEWLLQAGASAPATAKSSSAGAGDDLARRRPLIALHLSAGQPARIWPLANFVDTCRSLRRDLNARFVVIGAPGLDVNLGKQLNRELEEPALLAAGEANLPRTAAIMRRCDLFIGTDSGPAHIASAVDCPVVVFFGPGNETVMRPYARRMVITRAKHSCNPRCQNKTCAIPERHCLATILPTEVIAAALKLLDREK